MAKDILVFKKNRATPAPISDIDQGYKLEVWKPTLFKLLPPGKDYKYYLYWVFHSLGIFKNSNYSAYLLYNKSELVSSCLVIPSYFKWPFMGRNDVQFTYVMTSKKYRGKGVASKLIKRAMTDLAQTVDTFWYVTDTENIASIKVAEKLGFQCHGKGEKNNIFKVLKLNALNE